MDTIKLTSLAGFILLMGPTLLAMAILAVRGPERAREILESVPVMVPCIVAIGLGLVLLVYAAIRSFMSAYKGK